MSCPCIDNLKRDGCRTKWWYILGVLFAGSAFALLLTVGLQVDNGKSILGSGGEVANSFYVGLVGSGLTTTMFGVAFGRACYNSEKVTFLGFSTIAFTVLISIMIVLNALNVYKYISLFNQGWFSDIFLGSTSLLVYACLFSVPFLHHLGGAFVKTEKEQAAQQRLQEQADVSAIHGNSMLIDGDDYASASPVSPLSHIELQEDSEEKLGWKQKIMNGVREVFRTRKDAVRTPKDNLYLHMAYEVKDFGGSTQQPRSRPDGGYVPTNSDMQYRIGGQQGGATSAQPNRLRRRLAFAEQACTNHE